MEGLLAGINGVVVYLDDILITGPSYEEHLATLERVLNNLRETGLTLRRDKCMFQAPAVVYHGHKITPKDYTQWREGEANTCMH